MILGLALAGAAPSPGEDPRRAGEAAERALDFAAALDAYRRCVAEAADVDRGACRARLDELEPQAADAFAGWTVLATVRRDYRTLAPAEREARVRSALAADPDGPAALALRVWLANEEGKRGEATVARELVATPEVPAPTRAWLDATHALQADARRRRALGVGGALLGLVYAGVAARRAGPLASRSALLAAGVLGLVPAAFAWVWGDAGWAGFLVSGGVAALAVWIAPRVPPWLSVPGTLGALLGAAGWNGWLPSLGL